MTRTISRRGLLAAGIAVAALPTHAKVGPPDTKLLPDAQRRFTAAIDEAWLQARPLPVDQREGVLRGRGDALRAALAGGAGFDRWICTMSIVSTAIGRSIISMNVLGTRSGAAASISNFSIADKSELHLPSGSSLVRMARSFELGEALLVSGEFQLDLRRGFAQGLGIHPTNIDDMEFEFPAFAIRYTAITQPAWLKDLSTSSRQR
jgi:hypothetical protein